jgi:molybdenum cofactor sulfurtransferase
MNDSAYARFLERYPEYRSTAQIDALRASDYGRLDEAGHTYLDYTGGGMYGASQVRDHAGVLASSAFGNPHSASLASIASTDLV